MFYFFPISFGIHLVNQRFVRFIPIIEAVNDGRAICDSKRSYAIILGSNYTLLHNISK